MAATAIINRVPGAGERYRPPCRAGAHRVRSVIGLDGGCFAVGHARRPRSTLSKLRGVLAQVRRTFVSNVLVVGKELSKDVSQSSQSTFRIIVDLVRFDAQISLLFAVTVAVVSTSMLGYIGVW
jgi:hypothetical protein